jgi:hypothetical protein
MKTVKIQIVLVTLMIFAANYVMQAQAKKAALPDDQARLQMFVGKWVANVVMTNDKKQTFRIVSHMEYSSIADGDGVYGVETFDDTKLGKFRASYLLGYDPYEKKIHFYAIDNLGTCHDHDCSWKTPDHFYLEHNSTRDRKAYKEMIDLVFKDKNTVEFSETASLDGKVFETDKGTYKKEK